jgi:hypothetical protein
MATMKISARGAYPLLACLLLCSAAIAAESATPTHNDTKPAATDQNAKPTPKKKDCEYVSGSRIRPKTEQDCRSAFGPLRSYSKEDLDRTGEMDLNQALRALDPIFR